MNQTKLYCLRENRYFVEKFGNFSELKLPQSLIFFCWNPAHVSTYQFLQKGVRDFSYFVQILSFLQKLKGPGFYTLVFYIFINLRSRQNKKIANTLLQVLLSRKCVQNFSNKKFKVCGSWSSSKISICQTNYLVSQKYYSFVLIWVSGFA